MGRVTGPRWARLVLVAACLSLGVALMAAGVMLLISTLGPPAEGGGPGAVSQAGAQPRGAAARPRGGEIGRAYTPYVANWADANLPAMARASGAHYLSLPYLTTARHGSCALTWGGDPSQPVAARPSAGQLAKLQALGVGIIPVFGGYNADVAGEDIADSCGSVPAIAAAYESVLTQYAATRIDLDIEAASLSDPAGIARRSAALALVQRWAGRAGRHLQIVITFSGNPQGLDAGQVSVLHSAIAAGVTFSAVNLLAYDYFDSGDTLPIDMAAAAISGLQAVHTQLSGLYPGRPAARLWSMLAVTLMPGIDGNPKKTEVTSLADAVKVVAFARQVGLSGVSIWSLDRDNGECPGMVGSGSCSGIRQAAWAFSRVAGPYPRA